MAAMSSSHGRRLALVVLILLTTAAEAARQRSNRDWATMSDSDWERIEEELEEPEDKAAREEAMRKAREPEQTMDMTAFNNAKTEEEKQAILKKAAAAQGTPGKGKALGHVFVTVKFDGCCPEDRKAITKLGQRWSGLLGSTGMDAAPSIWKDNQIAFMTRHDNHLILKHDTCPRPWPWPCPWPLPTISTCTCTCTGTRTTSRR